MTIAKKDYICDFCGYVIKKGTDYYREDARPWDTWNESGKYYTFTAHAECEKLSEDLNFDNGYGVDKEIFKGGLLTFFNFKYDKGNIHRLAHDHDIDRIIALPMRDDIDPSKKVLLRGWMDFIVRQAKPELQEVMA